VSKGKVAALAVVLICAPFVAMREGVVLSRYKDPVGIPTACGGETDTEVVGFKSLFTRDECIAVMGASLYAHAVQLDKCVKRPIARHEAAAILSWSYNVGVTNACGSTLLRKLNAGQPFCAELDKWVYAKSIKLRGLVSRRAAERRMCETGKWE
jgi:lysozyme